MPGWPIQADSQLEKAVADGAAEISGARRD